MAQPANVPEWEAAQIKAFTNWVNSRLSERDLFIDSLFTDLSDGHMLYQLLEILSESSLSSFGRLSTKTTQIHKMQNMSIVFRYLKETVQLVGIGPADVVDGNKRLILALVYALIIRFVGAKFAVNDLRAFKAKVLRWAKTLTEPYPVEVTNFTSSFADGKAFMAILNRVAPSKFPYDPSEDPTENFSEAFEFARTEYEVAPLLDPNDPGCTSDEAGSLTYLAELMSKVNPPPEEYDTPQILQHIEVLQKPVEEMVTEYIDQQEESAMASLTDYASTTPPSAAAAEYLTSRGFSDVATLSPASAEEDPSFEMSDFVVGTLPAASDPENAPTIMLYVPAATAHTAAAAAAASLAMEGIARAVAGPHSRRRANEAATLVRPNVRILLGPSPPPSTASRGTAHDREAAERLAAFIAHHKAEIGNPGLVLAAAPDGSPLAPAGGTGVRGRSALYSGCKGEAVVTFEVATFVTSDGGDPEELMDPLLGLSSACVDATQALAVCVASMRDPATGAVVVPFPEPDGSGAVATNVPELGDDVLRRAAGGYRTESQLVDAPGLPRAVQLASSAGVSVSGWGSDGPRRAWCRVGLSLPPGVPAAAAVDALEEHVKGVVPYGAEIKVVTESASDGWVARDAVLAQAVAVGLAAGQGAEAIMFPALYWDPFSSALSAALPESTLLLFAHDGEPTEGAPEWDVVRATAQGIFQALKVCKDVPVLAPGAPPPPPPAPAVPLAGTDEAKGVEEGEEAEEGGEVVPTEEKATMEAEEVAVAAPVEEEVVAAEEPGEEEPTPAEEEDAAPVDEDAAANAEQEPPPAEDEPSPAEEDAAPAEEEAPATDGGEDAQPEAPTEAVEEEAEVPAPAEEEAVEEAEVPAAAEEDDAPLVVEGEGSSLMAPTPGVEAFEANAVPEVDAGAE